MPAKNLTRIADEGTLFHIYNKGVEGNVVFRSDEDFKVYTNFLAESLSPIKDPQGAKQVFKVRGRTFKGIPRLPKNYHNQVELIAYNLKPDHFHLVVHQVKKGAVESFIRSLCTRYSMYFNKKYSRKGSLFAGPYKSVEVKGEKTLQLLTKYLHCEGGYSSYPEYLGERNNPWVNTNAVLSSLDSGLSYKDFAEKSSYNQGRLLQSILLDGSPDFVEKEESVRETTVTKNFSGFPKFLLVSGSILILLTTMGIRNIFISSSISKAPLPSPAILAVTSEPPKVSSETKPKSTVKVKIDGDASGYVNIRQKPTTNSLKIGKAFNGDTFEFISLLEGWYEVRFATTSGFIAAKYIEGEQIDND